MHIRDYERPEGYEPGHPEVLVTPRIVEGMGLPVVDYDSLHQYLTDDLGIGYDEKTSIRLYGRWSNPKVAGFHTPYTRTIHISAGAGEYYYEETGGVMRVLAHEGRHRSDSTNRRSLTTAELAIRYASYKVGFELASLIPVTSIHLEGLGGVAARLAYYKVEPAEIRARRQEKDPSTMHHEMDILFPKSDRTRRLFLNRRLTDDKALELGFNPLWRDQSPDIQNFEIF